VRPSNFTIKRTEPNVVAQISFAPLARVEYNGRRSIIDVQMSSCVVRTFAQEEYSQ